MRGLKMKNIFSLFNGVFSFFRTITKSMYRRCAIIASGSAVIAVVCLNSTCYGGGGKNNVVSSNTGTGQVAAEDEEDEFWSFSRSYLSIPTALTTFVRLS